MYYATNEFVGNGSTTTWNINFAGGYIDRSHVRARLVSVDGSDGEAIPFSFVGNNQVRITPALPAGQNFIVYRDTPKIAPLVDFTKGAIFTENNLDLLSKQAIFVAAEAEDRYTRIVAIGGAPLEAIANALRVSAEAKLAADNAVAVANAAGTQASTALQRANDAHTQMGDPNTNFVFYYNQSKG